MRKQGEGENEYLPLFETKEAKGRAAYKLLCLTIFVGICFICVYRATHIPEEGERGRWSWMLMFGAELWFSCYWILTLSVRWNPVYRYTFKDRLIERYGDKLPGLDIFVCTADPKIEPPIMVINTVLSMMAYNYPTEKMSVYLSDDGGSELTFYALLEASEFSKQWIPFAKKFNIEPRSPAAYFSTKSDSLGEVQIEEFSAIEKLYEEMKHRIESAMKLGRISQEIKAKHKGFSCWHSSSSPKDHVSIVQILIDRRNPNDVDILGHALPTLVYMAREKRPLYKHHFKAGAMNSLIRVSSKISNGQIILNVDCDMYSNNAESIKDALCFFMDEKNGHQIAFVQFPQHFDNITKNDVYSNSLRVISEVELPGLDGYGGPLYIGTGCFHKREIISGMKYDKEYKRDWKREVETKREKNVDELEKISKIVASCMFEENTQWGQEMGLKYGCPVEDVLTGLSIQCRGWKSIYCNPTKKAFLGNAPITLAQTLIQHKRWSEGDFQIFLSKYNPIIYGYGKIKLGLQMGYCIYCLWAPNCLATLCYLIILPISLLKGIFLFPKISSPWAIPFAYVFITRNAYNLGEFIWSGGTLQGWWNDQRLWMYKRSTSYLFAIMDTLFKLIGFSNMKFDISAKVIEPDVNKRYELEMMEFGTSSSMFIILAILALFNIFGLVGRMKSVIVNKEIWILDSFLIQVLLCGLVIFLNLPLYQGLFLRKDNGRVPIFLTIKSVILFGLSCILLSY